MSKRKDVRQEKVETAASDAEFESANETQAAPAEAAAESAAPATSEIMEPVSGEAAVPARSYRFALLAALVALAAALGALLGSLGTVSATRDTADRNAGLNAALAQMSEELTALKAGVEKAKLASLADTVARLEKRMAAVPAHDVTGSVPDNRQAAKEAPKPAVLEGWILRDVYRGRALIENRHGLFEVFPGSNLPGIGRIETITQQNGRWVVVTPKGLIVSMR